MGAAVGIDLGTTYSVVAHVGRDGRPHVLPNEFSAATTPSVVYIGPDGVIVGEEAKSRQATEPDRVAAFFKREMGDRAFFLSFQGRDYTPVDLSALVIENLKATAERALGETVTDAVITVPAYFTHLQREDTKEAGRRAGLSVLEIINEPSAAARAYGFVPGRGERTALVYDLGGGTFDVSLVRITNSEIAVIATDGDHRLGGRDWDDRLLRLLAERFERASGVELGDEELSALLIDAEMLKRTLSARAEATQRISASGHHYSFTVTRADFEAASQDLVTRTEMLCERVLQASNSALTWADIDGVLPVGGSTRMPMVRACIERISGKAPLGGVNPDEAVGIGAAYTAALAVEAAAGHEIYALPGRKRVRDVTAHSLGMIAESADRSRYLNSRIIARNTEIPSADQRTYRLPTTQGTMTTQSVFVTQGEDEDPQTAIYLGLYEFTGFPESRASDYTVDVTYRYSGDGTVGVEGRERRSGRALTVTRKELPPDVPGRFLLPPSAQVSSAERVTLYLAVDLSGSMRGEPLAEAKQAAHAFISNCDLTTTAIGLISFEDSVTLHLRATNNTEHIARAIDNLAVGFGRGNNAHPFHEILSQLGNTPWHKYALVLTDGRWRWPYKAETAAKICHQANINVIAVGFGNAKNDFLKAIASSDEQSFFINRGQLTETFTGIARTIQDDLTLGPSRI